MTRWKFVFFAIVLAGFVSHGHAQAGELAAVLLVQDKQAAPEHREPTAADLSRD